MELEIKDIIRNVLTMPSHIRASIAEMLLESLDYEDDFVVSSAWSDEINRRCLEIDAGTVELIAGEEVLAQLRKKYS